MFSRIGAAAYKPGLDNVIRLDEFFGSPHKRFKSIHIAGTNGKGSVSSMLASVLQEHGFRTGLYTSPHLVDFRERIRIDGKMIPEEAVVDFVERFRKSSFDGAPSFFELTMMMAFDWFAKQNVDYAIIEVGMGGRLDSTNIITPEACVITNISFDHTSFLGNTLEAIAGEKAGIIKPGIPVVIGESKGRVREVFRRKTEECASPSTFADDDNRLQIAEPTPGGSMACRWKGGSFRSPLGGDCQRHNINTVLAAVDMLRNIGIELEYEKVNRGLENVCTNTGLRGRWTIVKDSPLTICDTGHNEAGLSISMPQLEKLHHEKGGKLRIVIGFVSDKDVDHIIPFFPKDAVYYFTNAAIPRAMPVAELAEKMERTGRSGRSFATVEEAYVAASGESNDNDVVFIGGSTFVVADFLAAHPEF